MTFKDKPKRPTGRPPARKFSPKAENDAAPEPAGDAKAERISKVMARAGVASRRDVERMIMEGRVTLNGKPLDTPVINVTPSDRIEVDGAPIRGIERTRLWLYHKPAGLVTTNSDPEGRPTVFDNLPDGLPRVMSIGRLDINTEGLLLLTNDGGLARVLELPATGWLRRYRVRAHGDIDQEALDRLKDGIAVDGVLYGSIEATLDRKQGSNVWITMSLREGKNREIKNVMGALGLDVNRLIRISYGPFQLGDLPEREVVEVRGRTLRDQLGPRLIEEAKANFDAPLYGAEAAVAEEPKPAEAPQRRERVRKEDKREQALGRLDTRRDGPRSEDDRPKKAKPLGTRRNANVWMAPGARPLGEKAAAKAAKNAKLAERRGEDSRARPQRVDDDRPLSRVVRVREEDGGEWIRSESRGGEDSAAPGGRKRYSNDRPPRADAAAGAGRPMREGRPDRFGGAGKPQREREEGRSGGFGAPMRGRGERGSGGVGQPAREGRSDRPAGFGKPARDRSEGGGGFGKPARERGEGGFGRPFREGRTDDAGNPAKPLRGRRPDSAGGAGKPVRNRRPESAGDAGRPTREPRFDGPDSSKKPRGGASPRVKSGGRPNAGGRDERPSGGGPRGGAKGKGPTRGADRRR